MPEIMHLIKIGVSSERAYQAVATAEGIRNWWTRDAVLDSRIGGAAEFGFNGHRFVIKAIVDALKPPAHVLAFAHRGFTRADENYAGATTRWGYYLLSLKRYLESGKCTPNPNDTDFNA